MQNIWIEIVADPTSVLNDISHAFNRLLVPGDMVHFRLRAHSADTQLTLAHVSYEHAYYKMIELCSRCLWQMGAAA